MMKKYLVISVAALILLANTAFAQGSGETVFRDTLYGTAIGALLGSAVYLADDDHFAEKLSAGIIVGTVGGLIYGLYETQSFVEIENDKVKVAIPTPVIEKKDETLRYSASLLKTRF
jgi:hypothetical protein